MSPTAQCENCGTRLHASELPSLLKEERKHNLDSADPPYIVTHTIPSLFDPRGFTTQTEKIFPPHKCRSFIVEDDNGNYLGWHNFSTGKLEDEIMKVRDDREISD